MKKIIISIIIVLLVLIAVLVFRPVDQELLEKIKVEEKVLTESFDVTPEELEGMKSIDEKKYYDRMIKYEKEAIEEMEKELTEKYYVSDQELESFKSDDIGIYYEKLSNYKEEFLKSIDDIVLVNKEYTIGNGEDPGMITNETMNAWEELVLGAEEDGLTLTLQSGYRSYEKQEMVYNGWVDLYGQEEADKISAKPGTSEHQTGLAIDVAGQNGCVLEECFIDTPEGKWLEENSYKYGFIIRYPKGKEEITGYSYEPWHIRYVGKEHAKNIFESNLTLEEYLKSIK